MDKTAFFAVTPFRIADREEYDSPEGERKRTANKAVSSALGVGSGLLAGTALGLLAGKAMALKYPGKFGISTKRFLSLRKKTGFNPVAPYIKEYVRKHGVTPAKIPAELHLPVSGAIFGSAAGMIPAEYRAIRKMEKKVGIEPQMTKGEYVKREGLPMMAGAVAAVAATEALIAMRHGKSIGGDKIKKIAPPALSAAAYTAANNMAWKIMNKNKDNENPSKENNMTQGEQIVEKIASMAIQEGYAYEMSEINKEAATCEYGNDEVAMNANGRGQGRGLGIGQGKGPIGPYGNEEQSQAALDAVKRGAGRGALSGVGRGAAGGAAFGALLTSIIGGTGKKPMLKGTLAGTGIGALTHAVAGAYKGGVEAEKALPNRPPSMSTP